MVVVVVVVAVVVVAAVVVVVWQRPKASGAKKPAQISQGKPWDIYVSGSGSSSRVGWSIVVGGLRP